MGIARHTRMMTEVRALTAIGVGLCLGLTLLSTPAAAAKKLDPDTAAADRTTVQYGLSADPRVAIPALQLEAEYRERLQQAYDQACSFVLDSVVRFCVKFCKGNICWDTTKSTIFGYSVNLHWIFLANEGTKDILLFEFGLSPFFLEIQMPRAFFKLSSPLSKQTLSLITVLNQAGLSFV